MDEYESETKEKACNKTSEIDLLKFQPCKDQASVLIYWFGISLQSEQTNNHLLEAVQLLIFSDSVQNSTPDYTTRYLFYGELSNF